MKEARTQGVNITSPTMSSMLVSALVLLALGVHKSFCTLEFQKEQIYIFPNQKINSTEHKENLQQKSTEVANKMSCVFDCSSEPWCRSVNFKTTPERNGIHICELLSLLHFCDGVGLTHDENYTHYSFEEPGSKNIPHWCKKDIDQCSSNPCQNNGTCADQVDGYNCTCVAGYTGSNCDTNIDECSSNPCQNNGTCADQVNGYNCTCVAGYTGSNCDKSTDIDDCANSPCQNQGTCIALVNGYSCICTENFQGENCIFRGSWLNVTSKPVRIGVMNETYASFTIPINCTVLRFQLVYDSGPGVADDQKEEPHHWGNSGWLMIHITDDRKRRITPPEALITLTKYGVLGYKIDGVKNSDPELPFPDISPPLSVTVGQEYRAWFGQDLTNHFELNNFGYVFVNVTILAQV